MQEVLWYIDAFADTGRVELAAQDQSKIRCFVSGSAERAIGIDNKSFDKLIFVEHDAERCVELANLKEKHAHKDVEIVNDDANMYLTSLDSVVTKY